MSEDKMRYEFEAWLFKGHDLPAQSISYTAEELLFKLWSDLKACAAIKDAEIAEARKTAEYWKAEHLAGNKEIAARDLVIKNRDAALSDLEYYIDNPSAWDSFSQNVSDAIKESCAVIDKVLEEFGDKYAIHQVVNIKQLAYHEAEERRKK